MATEEGIVTKISDETTWVTTTKTAACESCSSRKSCHTMGGGTEMEVEVINRAGASVGDRVVLNFSTSSLLKASFLLYVFPILFLVLGALVGNETAAKFNLNNSLFSAITGFLFFGISILFVKAKGNRMAKKDNYRPSILRILRGH